MHEVRVVLKALYFSSGFQHGVIGTVEKTFVVQPVRAEHSQRLRRDTSGSDTHIVYVHRNKRACDDNGKYKQGETISHLFLFRTPCQSFC